MVVGEIGMDAVGPVDANVFHGEVAGFERILMICADADNLFNTVFMRMLQKLRLLVGREPFTIMEMAMSIDEHTIII